jgi:hypothetical protein
MQITETSKHEVTRRMLRTNDGLNQFADIIIRCTAHHRVSFLKVASSVNFDATKMAYTHADFLNPVHGLTFTCMQAFQHAWHEGNPWPSRPSEWVSAIAPYLKMILDQRPELPSSLRMDVFNYLLCMKAPAMGDYDRFCDGFVDYLRAIRYQRAFVMTERVDPMFRQTVLEEVPRTILIPGAEAPLSDPDRMLADLFSKPKTKSPFKTGVRSFDRHYADSALPGDAWLWFALPGGGKTNAACQTAGYTAAIGDHVAYVSTEISEPIIQMRACAAVTGMDYGSLRGLTGSNRMHPLANDFSIWVKEGPGSRIGCFEFRKVPGKDYREKLMRMLDSYDKRYGRMPDILIWDWIGGALDEMYSDAWQKREAYFGVSRKMAEMADELEIKAITLAQMSKEMKNKTSIAMSDTQDAKNLADPVEGAVGFTSLIDSNEVTSGDQELHREDQFWVVCKCREEEALRLSVKRDFRHARFISP